MNNAFDNFIKGPITSVLGLCAMVAAGYFWFTTDHLTNWEAGVIAIGGFTLMFMKDKLPEFIGQFFKAALEKFGLKTDPPKEP